MTGGLVHICEPLAEVLEAIRTPPVLYGIHEGRVVRLGVRGKIAERLSLREAERRSERWNARIEELDAEGKDSTSARGIANELRAAIEAVRSNP